MKKKLKKILLLVNMLENHLKFLNHSSKMSFWDDTKQNKKIK